MAMLTPTKWQFKFFDVAQVKLPDDESSFLSEVWGSPSLTHSLSLSLLLCIAWEHHIRRIGLREHLLRQRRWRRAHRLAGLQGRALVQGA